MDLDETWQVGLRPEKTKLCTFPAKSRYGFPREREKKWVAEALFLADRTIGRAFGTACLSVCRL